jgi:heat shock protein HslJ
MKKLLNKTSYILLAVLGVCLMFGCMHQVKSSASAYGNWLLTSASIKGNAITIAGSNRFSLMLTEDGKASGLVACNIWHGQHSMEGGKLKVMSKGITKKRCQFNDKKQELLARKFPRMLESPAQMSVSGSTLELTLSSGDLWTFSRQP